MKEKIKWSLPSLLLIAIAVAGILYGIHDQDVNQRLPCLVLQPGSKPWNVVIDGLTFHEQEETWNLRYDAESFPDQEGRCMVFQGKRYTLQNVYTRHSHQQISVQENH